MEKNPVTPKRYFKVFYQRVLNDQIFDLAALLAYYFLLSLFPFLIFALALLSYFHFDYSQMLVLLKRFVPSQSYNLISTNLKDILSVQHSGLLSFGILFTIWTASNAINAMIRALNQAYNVKETRSFLIARGIAILLTFGMIVAIVIALAMPVFGKLIGEIIFSHLPSQFLIVWDLVRWLISFLIIVIVFSCLYYFAPNKKVSFQDVLFGAVVSAVGWQVISLGFSYYVNHFGNYRAIYGSLGGVIVLMIWFYLTALIIIIGGEINAVNWFFERKKHE